MSGAFESDEIGREFYKLLNERFFNNSYTTEKSITYTFFSLLVLMDIYKPHELLLEFPHPATDGNEKVDTYIKSTELKNGLIMECKYDRENTSSTSARTMKAGKIFNDLFRLASFDIDIQAKKWFIYVTDEIMSKYFINNNLADFFNLNKNNELIIDDNYLNNRPGTFLKNINKYGIIKFKIKCILKDNLPQDNKIRIYEIINIK
jgi:hypothetical protein